MDALPDDLRRLRACLLCSLIKVRACNFWFFVLNSFLGQTASQFKMHGCDNCERYVRMRGDAQLVADCTSAAFTGIVGVTHTQPSSSAGTSGAPASWVVRWQRLTGLVPGMYAVSVQGTLPDDIVAALERKGIAYVPRDNFQ